MAPALVPGEAGADDSHHGLHRAQQSSSSLSTTLFVAGLNLLGLPYAGLLGVTAGLFDLLPVVGPGLVLTPVALYLALEDIGRG